MTALHDIPCRASLGLGLVAAAFVSAAAARGDVPPAPANLAIRQAVTASGVRGRMTPALAVDGDIKTRWCNNAAKAAAWLCVDLGVQREVAACEIRWEKDGVFYSYIVEGSTDGKTWTMLNDQRGTEARTQVQRLWLRGPACRYVRVSVLPMENGGFASIAELQIFDAQGMKALSAAGQQAFAEAAPAYENYALNRPALASSTQGDRAGSKAVDGDTRTRWCASDASCPQWLEVDLQQPRTITDATIRWEHLQAYRWVLEGSVDNVEWRVLADQRGNAQPQQVQTVPAAGEGIRYVRVTVTGADNPDTWVSIVELKILNKKEVTGNTREE